MIDVYEAATPTVDGVDVAANLLTAHVVHLKRSSSLLRSSSEFLGNAVDDTRSCVPPDMAIKPGSKEVFCSMFG